MTPIEIFEYKQQWKSNAHTVRLHSDLRRRGKEYCTVQMMKHQWDIKEYTDVYEDTYFFEHRLDANSFAGYFEKRFVNQ